MITFSSTTPLSLTLLIILSYHSPALCTPCAIETRKLCKAAPFVPGHNLVGMGYDMATLERKGVYVVDVNSFLAGDGTCNLQTNPLQGNMLQKLPLASANWRAFTHCHLMLYNSRHSSARSLTNAYLEEELLEWQVGLDWKVIGHPDMGGSESMAFKFATERSKEDRYTFSAHWATCVHYSYRLEMNSPFTADFQRDLDALPMDYNDATKSQFRRFIKTYGTHYVRQVHLGGRLKRITATRTCLASLNNLTPEQLHFCLSVGHSVGLGFTTMTPKQQYCSSVLQNQDISESFNSGLHQHYTDVVGGTGWNGEFSINSEDSAGFRNWLETIKTNPDVVRYLIKPLCDLMPSDSKKAAMKTAIEAYLKSKAVPDTADNVKCSVNNTNIDSNCCPKKASRGALTVEIIRGWKLKGDIWDTTEAYAELTYGAINRKTRVIKSNNPRWNALYDLGKVDTQLLLKLEVWDEDWLRDESLGSCVNKLKRGTHTIICEVGKGGIEMRYSLVCDPKLGGIRCNNYVPSPM
ncbi:perforin-1-like [Aulostomus maculatus]